MSRRDSQRARGGRDIPEKQAPDALTGIDAQTLRIMEEELVPEPVDFQIVEVGLGAQSSVFETYTNEMYNSLLVSTATRGGTIGFTVDEFRVYLLTLLKSRIDYVNGRRPQIHPLDHIAIPAFYSVALKQIGLVSRPAEGLQLVPSWQGTGNSTLETSQMRLISAQLEVMEDFGFTFAYGYDRDRLGSDAFMTLELLRNVVEGTQTFGQVVGDTSPRHPVYAVFAAMFANSGLTAVLNGRRRYGNEQLFQMMIRRFTSPRSFKS